MFNQNPTDLIKAIIFDLDGVIVDTAHYHYIAWKRLAQELGIDLTLADNEKLKGVSRVRSMEIILALGGVTLGDEERESMANKKNTWFVDHLERMAPDEIFPGVKELLTTLRKRGIKVALASSSKNAKRVIQLLHIEDAFDVVVDGNMIVHSKPDPEIFLLAASKLGLPAAECLVFEDAEAGVEAAKAAGMKCVGIGSKDQLGKADVVLATTGEFDPDTLTQF